MLFVLYELFIAIPVAIVFFIIATFISLLRLIKAKSKEQQNSKEVSNDEKK